MKAEIRIVAGTLRGRKIQCEVHPDLRPTPQMVREAFFSILGNAIPNRLFVDLFAGTGVIGLEALSRGARSTSFVERDNALVKSIEGYLRKFDLMSHAKIYRTDVYRWISAWKAPAEPINIFISPPFPDLHEKPDVLLANVQTLMSKVHDESVIVLQAEIESPLETAPELADWEKRTYGRNMLLIWQREDNPPAPAEEANGIDNM